MRFLIAGLGSVGRRHLRNLVALGERDVILFRTGKSTLPDDELKGFPVEHDLGSALARRPDAVIISNPTARHLEVAIPAARAGCHLLIEKPISHSMERIPELERAVASGGGRVLVGYQYRFHPGLRQASEWLESGAIGRVVTAQADYGEYLPAWHPWEDHRAGYSARRDLGGGALLTLSHAVDNLLWLVGPGRVSSAHAAVVPEIASEVESAATLVIEFSDGGTGVARMDFLRTPKTHRFDVVGTRGSVSWDEASGTAVLRQAEPAAERLADPPPGYDRNDMFIAELVHLMRLCQGEEESVCSLSQGVETLKVLSEAMRTFEVPRGESQEGEAGG